MKTFKGYILENKKLNLGSVIMVKSEDMFSNDKAYIKTYKGWTEISEYNHNKGNFNVKLGSKILKNIKDLNYSIYRENDGKLEYNADFHVLAPGTKVIHSTGSVYTKEKNGRWKHQETGKSIDVIHMSTDHIKILK